MSHCYCQLSNGDQHRLARRWGLERVVGLNMMILTLPGIPFVYYGDEIGMTGPNISVRDSKDPIATSGIVSGFESRFRICKSVRNKQLSAIILTVSYRHLLWSIIRSRGITVLKRYVLCIMQWSLVHCLSII